MIATFALALSFAALALSAVLLFQAKRARRAHRELAQRLHDQSLALDQRCDALQRQIDKEIRRRKIDHLMDLVAACEGRGRFGSEVAGRLQTFTLALHDEARR